MTGGNRDGTRSSGPDIRLDGKSRAGDVFGSGTFAHESIDSETGAPRRIDAAWTDRMAFDAVAGTVLVWYLVQEILGIFLSPWPRLF